MSRYIPHPLLPLAILIALSAALVLGGPVPSRAASAPKAASPTQDPSAKKAESFEGAIDMTLAMEAARGDLRLSMAGERARLDMALTMAPLPAPISMAVLLDARRPGTAVIVNDAARTYGEIDLSAAAPPPDSAAGRYVVKELGRATLLGRACTHLTLKRPGELVDAWITTELPEVYRVLARIQRANPRYGAVEAFEALDAAGKGGLPMRCIVVRDGQRVVTEVRKIERRAMPDSLFAVPAGYAKTSLAGGGPSPEDLEKMRKMIEGALRQ